MMTAKDIETARLIEDWAHEQTKLHRRVCKDSGCIGRSKMWWLTRHPAVHPDVANKTAVDYILSRQCCEILELRLVKGPRLGEVAFTWLPGELELNRSRTVEEKAQLLGRAFSAPGVPESTSVEVTDFKSPEREFLEVPKDGKKPVHRRTAPHTEPIQGHRPQRAAVDETASADWVDALTRRRD